MDGESPAGPARAPGSRAGSRHARVLSALGRAGVGCCRSSASRSSSASCCAGRSGRIQLRERARLKQALLYSRLRRVALAIGERLAAAGRLDQPDDIFFLTAGRARRCCVGRRDVPRSRASRSSRCGATRTPELSATTPPDTMRPRRRRVPARRRPARAPRRATPVDGARRLAGRRRLRRIDDRPRRDPARRHRIAPARGRRHPRHAPDGSGLGADLSADLRPGHRARRHAVARRDHRARVRHPVGRRRQGRDAADPRTAARSRSTATAVSSTCSRRRVMIARLPARALPRPRSSARWPSSSRCGAARVAFDGAGGARRRRWRSRCCCSPVPALGRPRRSRARRDRRIRTACSCAHAASRPFVALCGALAIAATSVAAALRDGARHRGRRCSRRARSSLLGACVHSRRTGRTRAGDQPAAHEVPGVRR